MKWILFTLLICSTTFASEMTVEGTMQELRKFAVAYDAACLTKKDDVALDSHVSLRKINPKAESVVANYWYAKAVQSYPGKWTGAALMPTSENDRTGGMVKKEGEYLVSYYLDHLNEIKATVDMLLVMTK